jgi:hypothetical protein
MRYLGCPISGLAFEWLHHGPFDKRNLESLDTLCSDELVTEERVQFPSPGSQTTPQEYAVVSWWRESR